MVCLLVLGLKLLLPDTEGNPETFNISFNVTDDDGPIEGAVVSIAGLTGTTGSAGGCTVKNVPKGNQNITVSKTGYNDYTGTNSISEDHTFNVKLIKA